jgi:hypothetical protein
MRYPTATVPTSLSIDSPLMQKGFQALRAIAALHVLLCPLVPLVVKAGLEHVVHPVRVLSAISGSLANGGGVL